MPSRPTRIFGTPAETGTRRYRVEGQPSGIKKAARNISFAWAGGINKHDPHCYRIQTTSFPTEYDNTQNGANRILTVWRGFIGDFGADLLKEHYQASHH